jgi:hypothetical protein
MQTRDTRDVGRAFVHMRVYNFELQEISLILSTEQCIVLRFLSTGLEDLIPSDNHNGKVFFPELFSSRVFTEGSSLSSDHHLYTSHHLKLQLRESPQEDCEYS